MFCSKCGKPNYNAINFCRNCGAVLENPAHPAPVGQNLPNEKNVDQRSVTNHATTKDPDELTGRGIGSIFAGDGFFMVAVLLSATNSAVSSLLWLFLLIPALYFFGKGFSDIFRARQIRRRLKEDKLQPAATAKPAELPPTSQSVIEVFKKSISGELTHATSVTDATTRNLEKDFS